jgi:hypothetical protein
MGSQSILFAIALTCPTDIDRTVSLQRDVPTCNGARWCGALMVSNQTENPLAWNWNKLYVPCESLTVTSLSPACCSCCPSFYGTDAASTSASASDCTDAAAASPIFTPAAVSFWASVSAQSRALADSAPCCCCCCCCSSFVVVVAAADCDAANTLATATLPPFLYQLTASQLVHARAISLPDW